MCKFKLALEIQEVELTSPPADVVFALRASANAMPLAWCPHHQQTDTKPEDQIVDINFELRLGISLVGGENGFDFAHRIAPSNGISVGIPRPLFSPVAWRLPTQLRK